MAKYTKKDFAALTKETTKTLSIYKQRGKVVYDVDGMIDTDNPVNHSFLVSHSQKTEVKQIPREETYKPVGVEPDNDIDEEDENGILPLHISDKRYKHFLAKKTERAAELDQIKIEKLKGIVIPSELVKPVFLQHNVFVVNEIKIMMDEELRAVAKAYDIPASKVADIKGRWTEGINSSIRKATQLSVKAVDSIVNDFAQSRGVGERA